MGSCVSVSSFRWASRRVPLLPLHRDEALQPQDTVTMGGRGDIRRQRGYKQREGMKRDEGRVKKGIEEKDASSVGGDNER